MSKNQKLTYVPLDDDQQYYYCSDIDVAATLVAKNYELVSVEKINDTKATCIFKRVAGLDEVVDGYWSNRIEVKPFEFATARKKLKSRIYGMQKARD